MKKMKEKPLQDITVPRSCNDYKNIKFLEIRVSHDRKTVWINNEKKCLFRAQNVKQIKIDDQPILIDAYDFLKYAGLEAPQKFLNKLNAIKGDVFILQRISQKEYYTFVLDPKFFKDFNVKLIKTQSKEIYKELIAPMKMKDIKGVKKNEYKSR